MTEDWTWGETQVTDWWCPSEGRWVFCEGPCPDGTEHSTKRTYMTPTRILREGLTPAEAKEIIRKLMEDV